jgi:mitochondrial chaperone BCS1
LTLPSTSACKPARTGEFSSQSLIVCANSKSSYQSSVTFSGFLNALDGVASGEERIIFMTTNHLEQLDPALIRPGRVDLSMLIDDATPSQASRLFRQFYADHATLPTQSTGEVDVTPEELKILDEQLREMIGKGREAGQALSMAALQGLFIRSGPREAVEGCRQLLATKATS